MSKDADTPTADESESSFDWSSLAQDTTYQDIAKVQKNQTRIPIGKPSKEKFCRVHPGVGYELDLPLIEIKESNDLRGIYLPSQSPSDELFKIIQSQPGVVRMKKLKLGIYPDGSIFIWALNLNNGRVTNAWNQTALDGAGIAREQWVKLSPSMDNGYYETLTAITPMKDPVWPKETFNQILDKAFNGRIIESVEHPVISYLLGR
jgi:hypothetical protein